MMLFIYTAKKKGCWSAKNLTAARRKLDDMKKADITCEWAIRDADDRIVDSYGSTWVDRGAFYEYQGHLL